jgi:hypothetical protein
MRKRFRAAVLTAVAALGLLAASAVPVRAAAPPGYERCPKGRLCLFDGDYGTGAMAVYSSAQATLGAWDNKANSVYNRTGYEELCLYSEPDYRFVDRVHQVEMRAQGSGDDQYELATFTSATSHLTNNLSSLRWAHTTRQCLGEPEYFGWENGVESGSRPAQAFSDLNGDGAPDLLNRTWNGHLWFLKGDGAGVYVGSGWNQMTALTRHGDFSGDGHEDLLARDGSGRLWIYPGNGKGWFGARKLIGTGWNQMTALQAAGDMNGDGHDDLLARDYTGKLWIYPGDGHGRYGARKLVGTGWNQMRAFAAPGDLNGDGPNDLVVSDAGGKLWLYPGDGHGRYGIRKMIGAGGWSMFPSVLGVGDDSGDGRPDLLAAATGRYGGLAREYRSRAGGAISNSGDTGYTEYYDSLL